MATWAMKQRYAWIEQRLAAGEQFTRSDIVNAFTVTKQTASATVAEFTEMNPDVMRYDAGRKAFVRSDATPFAKRKPSDWRATALGLLEALQRIEAAPAWGAPERWETTPAELRQFARDAIAKALNAAAAAPTTEADLGPGTTAANPQDDGKGL